MARGLATLTPAERLLSGFGITEPKDIDLDAIAWLRGAKVRYRPLAGCEARIFGAGDQAVISVNINSSRQRRRFSLAHELGHWEHHRGKLLFCRRQDISDTQTSSVFERVANRYAADLLMPGFLFDPLSATQQRVDFAAVDGLATAFDVSRIAAAIRLVERSRFAAFIICHGPTGRRWFNRSTHVPERWFPHDQLDPRSGAFNIQFGTAADQASPRRVTAAAWFGRDAERYEIIEQTVRGVGADTITLLQFTDPKMLSDR